MWRRGRLNFWLPCASNTWKASSESGRTAPYQPGKRSGAWIKYRVNRGQELVIGGYSPGPHGVRCH